MSQMIASQAVMSRFAEALQTSGVDVVPKIVVGGILQTLLTVLLSEKMGTTLGAVTTPRDPQAEELRKKIREGLTAQKKA